MRKLIIKNNLILFLVSGCFLSAQDPPPKLMDRLPDAVVHTIGLRHLRECVQNASTQAERMWAGRLLVKQLEDYDGRVLRAPVARPGVAKQMCISGEDLSLHTPAPNKNWFRHSGASLFRSPPRKMPRK